MLVAVAAFVRLVKDRDGHGEDHRRAFLGDRSAAVALLVVVVREMRFCVNCIMSPLFTLPVPALLFNVRERTKGSS